MTVRKLLAGKPDDVSVIWPDIREQDVTDPLEADDVGALVVVSDDGRTIVRIISAADIVRGLKTFGRDVVDLPIGDLMTRDAISCDIGEHGSAMYYHRERELCGIISMLDAVKYRFEEIKEEAEGMKTTSRDARPFRPRFVTSHVA